jgi:DNA-binding transcriptional LysR family regulator
MAEEMWNARMPEALRRGTVDVAISCCPEIDRQLSYRPIRRERIVVLLSETHPLAGSEQLALRDLTSDEFLCAPPDLAPRYNEVLVGLCQDAGFDPVVSRHSLQTDWEIGILAESDAVSLAPESLVGELPPGVVAIPLAEAGAYLETSVMWRSEDPPPSATAFQKIASTVFPDPVANGGKGAGNGRVSPALALNP